MIYDFIIVGGGPAGSICSYMLSRSGYSCVLLEKRPIMDEKICGGFITDTCRKELLKVGINFESSGKRIKGYNEIFDGKESIYQYNHESYGLGMFRRDFDSYLLESSKDAGTKIYMGEIVTGYTVKNNVYNVNGVYGKHVIWAIGASGGSVLSFIPKEKFFAYQKKQSIGISEIIRVTKSKFDDSSVYFLYDETDGSYFWAIPIADNVWNIGYWSNNNKDIKRRFVEYRRTFIEPSCMGISVIRKAKGALLGNVDFSAFFSDSSMLCCGDFAGSNNIKTGEGIRQAVESALLAVSNLT